MKIEYKNHSININDKFIEKQGVNDIEELKQCYFDLYDIFDIMENTNDRILLYELTRSIEDVEFRMQKCWNFTVDRNMHRYWFECPKCTCPKLDNRDNIGTEYRIFDLDCIVHGELTQKLYKRKQKFKILING